MKMFKHSNSAWKDGEKALITRVCSRFANATLPSPYGSGDDCALIDKSALSSRIFLTSDAVILGRHFSEETPAELVGKKLLSRNASDIASMGAHVKYALLSAICGKDINADWIDGFCEGLGKQALALGIKIIGGDVASVPYNFFSAHLTLMGESDNCALLRSGARNGDKIFVTSSLGLSYESGKHLDFEPRLAEGEFLAAHSVENSDADEAGVSACTDISDGLASDMKNLLSENTNAILYSQKIPCSIFCGREATLTQALCDGEDYELLFTWRGNSCEFEKAYEVRFGKRPVYIGDIVSSNDKRCVSQSKKIFVSDDGITVHLFEKEGFSH